MQFLFYKYNGSNSIEKRERIRNAFKKMSSIVCEHVDYEWKSKPNNAFFIARNPDLEIYKKYKVINIDDENNLSFIHGWVKKENEDYLLDANSTPSLKNENKLDGFYVIGNIDARGNGEFYCSAISPHLYCVKTENEFAISNRISILSEIFDKKTPNKQYLASHIQYQHGPLTYDTMYKDIKWIPFGTKIKIESNNLSLTQKYDIFYDDKLQELYHKDETAYWDEFYNKLTSQINAFINLGIKDKLTLGLSGGVDSRLILSMYYKHLDNVFTSGPAYSPEVIVGKMVCDAIDMPHLTPSLRSVSGSFNLLKRLPKHLFAREFEMCPWDFGWVQERKNENIKLDGQEFIRVAPYLKDISIDDILDEEYVKYSKIQNLGVLPLKDVENICLKNNNICKKYLENLHDIRKFPTIRKVLNRGRWATRVHETIFDYSFHIYPLLTNIFIKYSYNSSVESIHNQKIAYEVIKRSCPELLEVPLFNKQFAQNPKPAIENKIPGKLNYKNVYLVRYFKFIKEFILENFNLIDDIVNRDFIENLEVKNVENNSKISQIIYNILQTIILFKFSDFSLLNNEIDVNFEFEEEKFEDTYDQDCISAFVQYNQDIVKLKEENSSLKHENQKLIEELKSIKENTKAQK